jgi:hypothetical protein
VVSVVKSVMTTPITTAMTSIAACQLEVRSGMSGKELTDSSPCGVPFRTFNLCPQISEADCEFIVDFLDCQVKLLELRAVLCSTIVHVHFDTTRQCRSFTSGAGLEKDLLVLERLDILLHLLFKGIDLATDRTGHCA